MENEMKSKEKGILSSTVFVSYRHSSERAKEIISLLEKNGIDIWLDRDIDWGDRNYQREIQNQIKRCNIFLAIVSKDYFESDWCAREFAYARALCEGNSERTIVPILLDNVNPRESFELILTQCLTDNGNDEILMQKITSLCSFNSKRELNDDSVDRENTKATDAINLKKILPYGLGIVFGLLVICVLCIWRPIVAKKNNDGIASDSIMQTDDKYEIKATTEGLASADITVSEDILTPTDIIVSEDISTPTDIIDSEDIKKSEKAITNIPANSKYDVRLQVDSPGEIPEFEVIVFGKTRIEGDSCYFEVHYNNISSADIRICSWHDNPLTDIECENEVKTAAAYWKYIGNVPLQKTREVSGCLFNIPVREGDFGKTVYVLVANINSECEPLGYAQIPVYIENENDIHGDPDKTTVTFTDDVPKLNNVSCKGIGYWDGFFEFDLIFDPVEATDIEFLRCATLELPEQLCDFAVKYISSQNKWNTDYSRYTRVAATSGGRFGFEIDKDDLGKTFYLLVVATDTYRNPIGYTQISVETWK